jgi:hypothetical protein
MSNEQVSLSKEVQDECNWQLSLHHMQGSALGTNFQVRITCTGSSQRLTPFRTEKAGVRMALNKPV